MAHPATWQRAERVLDEILDLDEVARATHLEALSRADPALHALVAAGLESAILARPAAELAASLFGGDDDQPSRVGDRVGAFRITGELGSGGMGTVYAAERVDGGFEQRVAVKVLKRGLDTDTVLRRFAAERRIVARLEHPNIARLIDGGMTQDGLPWFALERVDGQPITAYADARALDLVKRVGLVLDVCGAVAFAHGQRVVHRDIKPSNVLVDERGQVKLLDFGIARLLDAGDERSTRTSAPLFTPRYAAPEQSAGGATTVATDVWQLGRLLAEILPAPPPDLQRIAARATHQEPARRYATVSGLAEDLRRFLDGRPVLARGDSATYRARRFVGRHRLASTVAMVGLAVASFLGVLLVRARTTPARGVAASAFTLLTTGGGSQRQPTLSPDGRSFAFVAADAAGIAQVWTRSLDHDDAVALTSGAAPAASPRWAADGTIVFERRGLGIWSVAAAGGPPARILEEGSNPNLSRDGRWLVYERRGHGVWIARPDGSGARRIEAVPESLYVSWTDRHPALSPDGSEVVYFLAVAGPTGDFWRAPVGGGIPSQMTFDLAEGGTPAWMPDGRSVIVSSARDGARTLWRVPVDGSPPQPVTVGAGDDVWPDVSADGRRLVYTSARTSHVIMLRDPATGRDQDVHARRTPLLARPVLSPSGDRIAFFGGARAGAARIFTVGSDGSGVRQVTTGTFVDQLHPQWSADGGTLYFYEDHAPAWVVKPDGSVTVDAQKDPDGRRRTFRAVAAAGGPDREVLRDWVLEREMSTSVDPSGRRVVFTRAVDGSPRSTVVRELATGGEETLAVVLTGPRWSPDGRRIAGTTVDRRGLNCSARGTECVELGPAESVYWSADGSTAYLRRVAPPLEDPQLVAVDVVAVPSLGGPERPLGRLAPMRRSAAGLSFGPDGRIAWVAYDQGRQELWSAKLGGSAEAGVSWASMAAATSSK